MTCTCVRYFGSPASAIARHADVEITLAIYAHTNLDEMRRALDAIDWKDDL